MEMAPVQTPAETIQQEFGAQMKRARKHAGLSQRSLADLVGVDPETINRVERGFNTRVETMAKIQAALPGIVVYSTQTAAHHESVQRLKLSEEQDRLRLTELQTRVMHLIQAIQSIERLQKLQAYALKALQADLQPNTIKAYLPRKVQTGRTR